MNKVSTANCTRYGTNLLIQDEAPKASSTRLAVTMTACVFVLMVVSGMTEALSVFYVELIAAFDAPKSTTALVQSTQAGFCLGGGIIFSGIVTKFDQGYAVIITSICAAISFCSSTLAPSIEVVIVLVGVMTGLACSINRLIVYLVASWMFHDNRKFALCVLTLGSSLGKMTVPYIATVLIDAYHWTGAALLLGGVAYLNCIPCGLLVHYSKPYFHKGDAQKLKYGTMLDLNDLKDVAFMLFVCLCFTAKPAGSVEQWFVVDMSVVKGYSMSMGAALLSVNGISAFTGRLLCVFLMMICPDTRQELHLVYVFFTWGMSHVIVSQSPSYWGMVLGILLRGLCAGLAEAFLSCLNMEIRGIERFPQTLTIGNLMKGAGSIVGGYLGGLSFDITSSYDTIFFIAAGISMINSIIMFIIYSIFNYRRDKQLNNEF